MGLLAKIKLREKIVILVCVVVLLALLAANRIVSTYVAEDITAQMGRAALYVSRMVARSEVVTEGLSGRRNARDIQVYANSIRDLTGYIVVVVFDMDGIRKSHPEESSLGQHVVGGDEEKSLHGEEYLSVAEGSLGPQLRAFTPVYDNGTQVGAVVVGIHLDSVGQVVEENKKRILIGIVPGLLVGIVGAFLLAHGVKKTLFGLEPEGIARLLEERNAMLYSVKEAILAVDKRGNITIANEAAIKMLDVAGIKGDLLGQHVDDVIPNTGLHRVLNTGQAEFNQEQDLTGIRIITNRVPVQVNGEIVGALATFRDKTEVNRLAEELTGVRSYVDALRSQAHEFMNKLHVVLGLVQLKSYGKLEEYIQKIAHSQTEDVNFISQRVKDSVVAGLLLSKLSRAREVGVELHINEESFMPQLNTNTQYELVTILGNLIDNAMDAVSSTPQKVVKLLIDTSDEDMILRVQDSGCGLDSVVKEKLLERGFSTKKGNRGFGLYLVNSAVERLHGSIKFSGTECGTVVMVVIPHKEYEND